MLAFAKISAGHWQLRFIRQRSVNERGVEKHFLIFFKLKKEVAGNILHCFWTTISFVPSSAKSVL